ncbi:MAG: hypothetical protein AMJ75_03145 [Phycisphaerae bacterium SM1_79]|nr:MAG: hypothetical protein AMJ75_03145 [Phycisphaerae bacterium SM1_79]
MNGDIAAYVVMSIMATASVLAAAIGAARNNPDAVLVGILIGVYATIIGTNTSVKRQLKNELGQIKQEIKDLRQ